MSNSLIIITSLFSSILSGIGVALVSFFSNRKKEKIRNSEREHDLLKIEVKDLQLKLYQLEKDLDVWKEKYYATIQELISVRAEFERSVSELPAVDRNKG